MRNKQGSATFVGLTCLSLFFPLNTYADSIRCYANDKVIFSRKCIHDVMYNGMFFAFTEDTGKIIIANTNCIVKLDTQG